jgi:diguanylate cyclase (GGDEF)-like protein
MNIVPPEVDRQLLLDAFTMSTNGLAVLNADNTILFHNTTFIDMFKLTESPMIGRHFNEIMTWMYINRRSMNSEFPSLQEWLDYLHNMQGSPHYRQFEVELTDGRWLLIAEQTHVDGATIILCSDITQQKNTELSLRDAQAELQLLAQTDELTGLANRRYFMQHLEREINRSRRHHHPLCLAMLDIDFFKNINDDFGHLIGDKILMHFAQFLQTHFRASDFVGRLGGEEFAILLPETKVEDAFQVIDRAIKSVSNEKLSDIQYSFSAGLATFPDDLTIDSNWLLARANKALHIAKSTGRSKAVISENNYGN